MRVEAGLFEILTGVFILGSIVYGVLTAMYAHGGIEWAGLTALVLTAGLTLIIGTFFRFVARRVDLRPEDYGTPTSPTAPVNSASSRRTAGGRY